MRPCLARLLLSCVPSVVGFLALAPGASAQSGHLGIGTHATRHVVTGRVCFPDGSPAVGARVTSSAGGSTLTSADGRFVLRLRVPSAPQSVEVTAVADARTSATLSASVRVAPSSLPGTIALGTLVLLQPIDCEPGWQPTYGTLSGTGLDSFARSTATFDDGSGRALYVGGSFTQAGGQVVNRIARWDGSVWSPLGSGVDGVVSALAVFDDGNGPALYVGGYFDVAGGVTAKRIARWDGASWSALGAGITAGPARHVLALAVFDDGSGPALYAAGKFQRSSTVDLESIARWDGSTWSALAGGISGEVASLAVYDDGNGPALYAGGAFTLAGGVAVEGIARWDGVSWSDVGGGVTRINGLQGAHVQVLQAFDDGHGAKLYAGGNFNFAGGVPVANLARWDGANWSTAGPAIFGVVEAFTVFDDGSGRALHAGGLHDVTPGVGAGWVARWTGASWAPLAPSGFLGAHVYVLGVQDLGHGTSLVAGGTFGNGPAGDSYLARFGCDGVRVVGQRKR